MFFLSGLTLPTSELAAAAYRVREHTFIQGVSLVVLPMIMWSITTLLGARISATLRAGLLVMSALPTTVNMCVALTRSAGGNEALAIFNAVIGNVLGVVVTPPLLLLLLGASADISIVDAMTKLTKKVVVPLVVGQLVRPALADALKVRALALTLALTLALALALLLPLPPTHSRGARSSSRAPPRPCSSPSCTRPSAIPSCAASACPHRPSRCSARPSMSTALHAHCTCALHAHCVRTVCALHAQARPSPRGTSPASASPGSSRSFSACRRAAPP